jgi:serine/threonine-protein kinase
MYHVSRAFLSIEGINPSLLISREYLSSGIVTVMLASVLFTHGSASGQITNDNFITYDNPNLGIKIEHPADWTIEEHDFSLSDMHTYDIIFLVPNSPIKYAEKLVISVLDENRSLTDVVNDLIDSNKHNDDNSTQNYQLIESTPTVVNNMSANKIVHTYTDSKFGNVKAMLTDIRKGNKLYDLLFTSEPEKFDNLLPIIQKMIDSFQIT